MASTQYDVSTTVPNTSIATSHGISITVGGTLIGMIQTWNPTQSRQVTAAYELNSATSGAVVEQIPGNVQGLTIQVSRYDLFRSKMEEIWGFSMVMLSDQSNKIDIEEKLVFPSGDSSTTVYQGCWFSNLGRTLSAQGDRIINVNATLAYVTKTEMT